MTNDDTTKKAAIYLLKRGLAISDIARLAGRSRQIVAHWAKGLPETRAEYLKKQWERASRRASPTRL